jgi:hypothetical protein
MAALAQGQTLSPAVLASLAQAQGQTLSPAAWTSLLHANGASGPNLSYPLPASSLDAPCLPAATLATLLKSGRLPADIKKRIPRHILESASRMSLEQLEAEIGN